jgi:hypothetical protein
MIDEHIEPKTEDAKKSPVAPIIDITALCEHPELMQIMNALSFCGVARITADFSPQQLEKYAAVTGDTRALAYVDYMMEPGRYELVEETTARGTTRTTLCKLG